MNTIDLTAPEARGQRLKKVRNLANLTRKAMCDSSELNINSFKGWEIGRYGGLTRSGAEKIIKRLAQEHVHVTIEWLMSGTGAMPYIAQENTFTANDAELIHQELKLFQQLHHNTLVFTVEDDAMEPAYYKGEIVAGVHCDRETVPSSALGTHVIAQLADGRTLLRILKPSDTPHSFNLFSLNPHSNIAEPVIYHAPILAIAPVIWHRRSMPDWQI